MPSVAPCPAVTAARATAARSGDEDPRRADTALGAGRAPGEPAEPAEAGRAATAALRAPARSALAAPPRCARAGPAGDASEAEPADGDSGVSAEATADPATTATPIPTPTPSATANPPTRPTNSDAPMATPSASLRHGQRKAATPAGRLAVRGAPDAESANVQRTFFGRPFSVDVATRPETSPDGEVRRPDAIRCCVIEVNRALLERGD